MARAHFDEHPLLREAVKRLLQLFALGALQAELADQLLKSRPGVRQFSNVVQQAGFTEVLLHYRNYRNAAKL